MRIGVTLPTFSDDAAAVLGAAREAESLGIHGVFSFDHLWPLGHPERPSLSLFPVLGAVAAVTDRLRVGSLVARLGLLPDAVVVSSLLSLAEISGGRLIAGLGTGDDASMEEHTRNGILYLGTPARHESLREVSAFLLAEGVECWVGAGKASTNETARSSGAILNYWGATPERLARAAALGPVTWGGPLPDDAGAAASTLQGLSQAGASWAVWGWPSSLAAVVGAAERAGIPLGS
ncbi:MAG: LLM class flavin-dependent oxidoreductase [Acidimicrobiales bacterium]